MKTDHGVRFPDLLLLLLAIGRWASDLTGFCFMGMKNKVVNVCKVLRMMPGT